MWLSGLAQSWGAEKQWLSHMLGLSPDALHVHVSIAIMLGAAIVWRRRMDHLLPWATVFVLELLNEFLDLSAPPTAENAFHASLHDVYNTMFLPTLVLLCLRFTRTWRRA
jgi:hypothetical protein